MYEMEQFVQASILLAILTVAALPYTVNVSLLLLVCGIFMLFFTLRSLSGGRNRYAAPVQLLLSAAYVAISGYTAAYLIFYEFRADIRLRRQGSFAHDRGVSQSVPIRSHGQGILRLILPSAMFFAVSMVKSSPSRAPKFPYILLGALLLFAAVLLIAFAESLSVRYIFAKAETKRVVRMTALAELYEKKLNQELVMKNYLADKNARLEERENISRNIHNSVGHSMTAAIMALDAAELLLPADLERAEEKVRAANRRIHTGLDSIRQAVRILDRESNYFLVEDFLSYINEVAENFMMDTTLQVGIDDADVLPGLSLPHEYSEFLVGAVSELLTNGVRHGRADIFSVRLAADSAHIRVSVQDNGVSDFSPENAGKKIENGYGLKKMISFAQKCGGSVAFENTYGFKTVITLPLYPCGITNGLPGASTGQESHAPSARADSN